MTDIVLGIAVVGPIATIGGLVHLVHQGVMKITLFLCAGNLAEILGIHKVSEMYGVGRRIPWTMAAFTIGAFGVIGAPPPLAGFISKWYLGLGALEAGQGWVIFIPAGGGAVAGRCSRCYRTAWGRALAAPWRNHLA